MSDPCYVQFQCRKSDFPTVSTIFGIDEHFIEDESEAGNLTIGVDQVSFGGDEYFEKIAKAGVVVLGWHSEGSYDPHRYCTIDGEHHQQPTNRDSNFTLVINDFGEIDEPEALERIKAYLEIEGRVRRFLFSETSDKQHTNDVLIE